MGAWGTRAWGTSAWGGAGAPVALSAPARAITTWAAIRAQKARVIAQLVPISRRQDTFRLTECEEVDFSIWAELNDSAVLREFEIVDLAVVLLGGQDHERELRQVVAEIVVAYPHQWRTYVTEETAQTYSAPAMRALIEEDHLKISSAVLTRGADNYLAGELASIEEGYAVDDRDGVSFLRIGFETQYYHEV